MATCERKKVSERFHQSEATRRTPRVFGQLFFFAFAWWYARPALRRGLSIRPIFPTNQQPPPSSSKGCRLTSSSDNTNGCSRERVDRLLRSRRQSNSSLSRVEVVSDDGSVVSRGSGEGSSVSGLLLDVADDGSFREGGEREDVSDGEGSFLSTVDERSGGESFGGDEELRLHLVSVRVTEDDSGEGSSTVEINDTSAIGLVVPSIRCLYPAVLKLVLPFVDSALLNFCSNFSRLSAVRVAHSSLSIASAGL